MRQSHRLVALVALLAIGLSGWAQGQVLEQLPSNAVGVFHVKDLQGLSTKIASLAKRLGIDQMDPRWADPLGMLTTQMGLKQGINKNGDLGMAFFKPKMEGQEAKDAASDQPPLVVLVPVDDYAAFLTNFDDVKDLGQGMSEVTVKANHEKLYVVKRGKYAASAMDKSLLSNHDGFKLEGPAAKEAQTKDAIVYFHVKAVRADLQKAYEGFRDEVKKSLQGPNNPVGAQLPPFVIAMYDKVASQFLSDTRSVAMSFNLTDAGLSTGFIGDFENDSYLGKLVSQSHNTDKSMFAGMPDKTYLMFGGATITPKVFDQLITDLVDLLKQSGGDAAKNEDLNKYLAAAKKAIAGMQSTSFGMVAPEQGENLFQSIAVSHGDAKQIMEAGKEGLAFASSFMGMMPQGMKMDLKLGEPSNMDGVQLQPFTLKMDFPANDPVAAQQKQMIAMMYGPNGMSGTLAVVNDHTFVQAQGVSDKLLADTIAAAKSGADPLDKSEGLKLTRDQLPKERGAEFYIALDNIANAVVKFMKQQGMAIQFKLPPDLPPIGASFASDGAAGRVDAFIPTKLVEAITSAAMQTWMQMNGAPGKGV